MTRKLTLFFLSILMLVSCGPYSGSQHGEGNKGKETGISLKEQVPPGFFPQKIKIAAVGDSLTQGVGDSTDQGGYVPYLTDLLEKERSIKEVEVNNFGVKGNRTNELLETIGSPDVQTALQEADIVIMTIGGNDIMKVVRENFMNLELNDFEAEQELFKTRLTDAIESIRAANPDSTVILIGLYNPFVKWFADVKEMDEIVEGWNDTSQSVIEQYNHAYFVDINDLFLGDDENLLFKDHFHPNDRGYELIAGRVYAELDGQALKELHQRTLTAVKEEIQDQ
ncbi:SGNH/GDSL hydrolase family protein [Bacillus sp. T33-2]|uniref:SGNH/GDSL hydrolase family protein n=1 Tax=Bacillus sp. T33-2 TaxID=2054168 RepID=UPI000C7727DB|nr:SGNH/GDSL hydrolase family protein [Bacillus sp. T33-2]PLR98887.1 GDSL family lipase [Bacillus sp. T33-2]